MNKIDTSPAALRALGERWHDALMNGDRGDGNQVAYEMREALRAVADEKEAQVAPEVLRDALDLVCAEAEAQCDEFESGCCRCEASALVRAWLAAAPQPPEASQWLPMGTLPAYGVVDLLLPDGSTLMDCMPQRDGDIYWGGAGFGEKFLDPEYCDGWRRPPLPKGPKT